MTSLRKLKKRQLKAQQSQPPQPSGPVLTPKQQEIADLKQLFIALYPEYGTIGATLAALKIKSRTTFYNWCKEDSEFSKLYESELQPNRRDVVASTIFRAAIGKEKLNKDQLAAAFGFLKATEAHKKGPEDDLEFTERTKSEVGLKVDNPIESVVRVVDAEHDIQRDQES